MARTKSALLHRHAERDAEPLEDRGDAPLVEDGGDAPLDKPLRRCGRACCIHTYEEGRTRERQASSSRVAQGFAAARARRQARSPKFGPTHEKTAGFTLVHRIGRTAKRLRASFGAPGCCAAAIRRGKGSPSCHVAPAVHGGDQSLAHLPRVRACARARPRAARLRGPAAARGDRRVRRFQRGADRRDGRGGE